MAKAFSICSWQHWKLRYLIGGISAWYILKNRNPAFFLNPSKLLTSDCSCSSTNLCRAFGAEQVYKYQPENCNGGTVEHSSI